MLESYCGQGLGISPEVHVVGLNIPVCAPRTWLKHSCLTNKWDNPQSPCHGRKFRKIPSYEMSRGVEQTRIGNRRDEQRRLEKSREEKERERESGRGRGRGRGRDKSREGKKE